MTLYKDSKLIFNLELMANYFSTEKNKCFFKGIKNIGEELFNEV